MSSKNMICFLTVALLANSVLAGTPRIGVLNAVVLGARTFMGRVRGRAEPAENAREQLEGMRQLLQTMQNQTFVDAQATLAQMIDLHGRYLDFLRDYQVDEGMLGARHAARFVEQAENLVGQLRRSAATPVRGTNNAGGPEIDNGISPTGARLSGRFERLIAQTPEPVVRELRPLVQRLLEVQERDARRGQAQVEALLERLSQTELVAGEVMTIRGAVEQILRSLPADRGRALLVVPNNGALLPSVAPSVLFPPDVEENNGELLPSDDDES